MLTTVRKFRWSKLKLFHNLLSFYLKSYVLRGSVGMFSVLKVIHVGEGVYLAKIIKSMLQSREKNICVQKF